MQATTVAARGEAEANYDLVEFDVLLTALADTVPASKAKLKKKVDGLSAVLEEMQKNLDLKFVKNSVRSNSSVQEKHEWIKQSQVFQGHEATYSLVFRISDLTKISQVYDVLTSVKEVRVSQPRLMLKNQDAVNKKALKHAFAKVSDRFETECKVFGLSPADFEVVSWEVSYSDSQRSNRVSGAVRAASARRSVSNDEAVSAMSAMGGGSDGGEAIEIVTGLAKVTVNLEVGYARKEAVATIPSVKASVVKVQDRSIVPPLHNSI
jgi:uncharacterized protein YggE